MERHEREHLFELLERYVYAHETLAKNAEELAVQLPMAVERAGECIATSIEVAIESTLSET